MDSVCQRVVETEGSNVEGTLKQKVKYGSW